jgi:hypothetical protein
MNAKPMIIIDVLLFTITLIFGAALASSAKHYNVAIFAIHKLSALGVVVLTSIFCYNLVKNTSISASFLFILAAAVVSTAALFVTGALMGSGSSAYRALRIIHLVSNPILILCEIIILIRLIPK